MSSPQRAFVDSNIWLYRFLSDQDPDPLEDARKRGIASSITTSSGIFSSTQVINEVCSVLMRRSAFNEAQILSLIRSFEARTTVIELDLPILKAASSLRSQYHFSFWDGFIVASALAANVTHLYTEDMQDGLIVAERLAIENPFK
jgi:predicted nucleic acid-binding protein